MHELSLAIDLVERAVEIAQKESAQRVTQVTLRIGELSGVDLESFKFAFPEACKKTILETCELVIVNVPGNEFQFIDMEIEDV